MMEPWLYLTCCFMLSAYVLLWSRLRRARALLAGLPSYPQLPFIGNLLQVAGDSRSLFLLIDDMSKKADESMKPFQLWMGPFPILIISDPDDVRTITNNFIEKPYHYDFGRIWLGNGLVTAPGALWKQNIKRLSNTFNTSVVESYQMVYNKQAHILVENLKQKVGKEPFDVMHLLAYTTLETICQTALGSTRISDSIVTKKYYVAFNRSMELLIQRGLNLLLHPECLYRLTSAYRELKRNVAVIHNVSDTLLTERKLERKIITKNGLSNETGEKRKFKALLDVLLDLNESDPRLTEQQIKHDVDTIILGGQETVASTLFYTILMIGCRPRIQEKLYEEMKAIFGDSTRPVETVDLNQMKYCEAVLNETLRLYPPLPGVMRYADRELQLKSCTVPKGTCCDINVWGAGRSKRTWGPDADKFIPERWMDGSVPSNPAAFLPFSYGRRACIGKKYAMALLKTVMAYCVRELLFTSEADHLKLKIDVTLRPVSGHLIQVMLRK